MWERTVVTLSSASGPERQWGICDKSSQGRKTNWWDGLHNESIAGKGRDGGRAMRQHYWRWHVTGTILDTVCRRLLLYPGEGGKCTQVVPYIEMVPSVPHLLIFTHVQSPLTIDHVKRALWRGPEKEELKASCLPACEWTQKRTLQTGQVFRRLQFWLTLRPPPNER